MLVPELLSSFIHADKILFVLIWYVIVVDIFLPGHLAPNQEMLFAKLSANQNQISLNIILMLGKCVRKRHPRTPHALAKFSAGFAEKLFAMFAQAYPSRPINNLWLLHLPVCMHQMNQHAAILPENQPVLLDGNTETCPTTPPFSHEHIFLNLGCNWL